MLGVVALLGVVATATAGPSAGDAQSALTDAVVAARGDSGCAPMAPDTLAQRAAQLANVATADYVGFRSAAVPFTDPMPALTTIGYSGGGRAMLLAGYGNDPESALRALQLQWRTRKPDCSFTRFGTAAAHDDAGFDIAAAVLIAPAGDTP